jgi:phosphatidylglycerophosphatase A
VDIERGLPMGSDLTHGPVGGLGVLTLTMCVWVSFGLIAGGMPLGGGLYVSQFLLVALFVAVVLYQCGQGKFRKAIEALFTVLIFVIWVLLIGAQVNARFIPESSKLLLLICSAMVFSDFITWRQVRVVAATIPWLAVVILSCVLVIGVGDYFGYGAEGRFGVPWWGSPNSSGFVIAIAIACALFSARLHWAGCAPGLYRIADQCARVLVLLMLGIFLVLTDSQGGLLCAGVVVLRFAGFRMRTIFGLLAGSVMAVVLALWVVPSFELPELFGSGRLVIWTTLLNDLFGRGVSAWLFGVGPGAIDLSPGFTERVLSAHSMYVEVLYSFGLLGLLIMIVGIRACFRSLSSLSRSDPHRVFLDAVFGAVVVGFLVDTYLLGAQLTWFGGLLLSWIALANKSSNSAPENASGMNLIAA